MKKAIVKIPRSISVTVEKAPIIQRAWAMPNHNTFSIKCIYNLISRYIVQAPTKWIDPFSRNTPFKEYCITNDLSNAFSADYHMEALDFLDQLPDNTFSGALFDPPYSPRQITESYQSVGLKTSMQDTQTKFYSDRKALLAKKIVKGGVVISFGWNSGGIGKKHGFEIIEILMVCHGSSHNDTICTVERKINL